jgi:hypothetical protein
MSLLYCYGVVESEPLEEEGFGKIFTVSFKDITAVVSSVSESDFSQEALDKNVKDMKWLALNAPIHEKVVTRVMKKTTIIPMKFCTLFSTKEHLLKMLEEKYGDLKYNLNSLNGKVEMNVKVYVDFEEVKKDISDPEILRLEEEIKQKTPGQAYMLKQKVDLLTKGRIQEKLHAERKMMLQKLSSASENIKENKLFAIKGKEMFLNVAVLIGKKEVVDFEREVLDYFEGKFECEITGPFAPYNFVK